jgi:hypothetical protein
MSFILRVGPLAVTFFQDFFTVMFQLVCLSRLGTKDYYKVVHENVDENGTVIPSECRIDSAPSLASSVSVSSTLLFVTLLIFTGPFVNNVTYASGLC